MKPFSSNSKTPEGLGFFVWGFCANMHLKKGDLAFAEIVAHRLNLSLPVIDIDNIMGNSIHIIVVMSAFNYSLREENIYCFIVLMFLVS